MKRERAAASRSTIVETYVSIVKALPPSKRPTFNIGQDFRYRKVGIDSDGVGYADFEAVGNLDQVLRRIAKRLGVKKADALDAVLAWKGLSKTVSVLKVEDQ